MMNIDYKITFQDDLDLNETSCEYSFNRPWFKWIIIRGTTLCLVLISLVCTFFGITESTELIRPYSKLGLLAGGLFMMILGIIYYFLLMNPNISQSFLDRREMKKKWSKKPSPTESRNITITDTEFIFKTEHSETVWQKKAIKQFFEGSKGFIIWFYSGHQRYIPKRIFNEKEGINQFKAFLEQNVISI